MLSLLEQNPNLDWKDLIGTVEVEEDRPSDFEEIEGGADDTDSELTNFTL